MQTDLRLILLIVGLFVVAAIFLDGIKRRKNGEMHSQKKSSFGDAVDSLLEDFEDPSTQFDDIVMVAPKAAPQKKVIEQAVEKVVVDQMSQTIVLTLIAKSQLGFSGKALLSIMQKNQLILGDKKLYERCIDEAVLYSVASLVEPGIFEAETMLSKNYSGLIFFMPINSRSVQTFQEMMQVANNMAERLNATVCDFQRQPLSLEKAEEICLQLQNRAVA